MGSIIKTVLIIFLLVGLTLGRPLPQKKKLGGTGVSNGAVGEIYKYVSRMHSTIS